MATEHQKLVVGQLERLDGKINVPPTIALEDAITVLQQELVYAEQLMERSVTFENHPYEVAAAFGKAIEDVCGRALGQSVWTFFGENPPEQKSIEVEPGKFVHVLWGKILFPLDPKGGSFTTSHTHPRHGPLRGVCIGTFKQKYLPVWDEIITKTRENLVMNSIFRGKTLRVNFDNPEGMPSIKAWNVKHLDISHMTFSETLQQLIDDHIFTPIKYYDACKAAGVQFKRGVLLAGPYGTGKTLLAGAVARIAAEKNMTVIYIEDVSQLPQALRMAAQLAPAVVFAEDIDRLASGERSHEIDTILNTLDGIDTKSAQIMTILTTNYVDKVYKGMVRPGRIDVALEIMPPDSGAAQRLVKSYLGQYFNDKNGDLEEVGNSLAGKIPAVIREVCERSKLSYISRTGLEPSADSITADDVLRASKSMQNQLDLLNAEPAKPDEFASMNKMLSDVLTLLQVTKRDSYGQMNVTIT